MPQTSHEDPLVVRRSVTVRKGQEEVYAALVEPDQLAAFFVDESTGPLEAGKTVTWRWGEERDETHCEEAVPHQRLVLRWKPYRVPDYETSCTITLTPKSGAGATTVTIEERGWRGDAPGVASALEHSAGWEHMLLCLKAYLEHGIDLRR